jgi:WD40 repeat protein
VFISYSHKDTKYVARLKAYLASAGLAVWTDEGIDYGTRWAAVIQQQIENCSVFVPVMSTNSGQAAWVAREIDLAQDLRKPILPLLLNGSCFLSLRDLQVEAVSGGRMPSTAYIDRLGHLARTSLAPMPPQRPQRVRRRTLLVGLGGLVAAAGGGIVFANLSGGHDAPAAVNAMPVGPPLVGHTDGVAGLVFLSEQVLASGSVDRTARLWDVSDPTHPIQIGQPLTGHTDMVIGLACSPDGKVLATGSGDTTVGLWDVSNPARPVNLRPITAHTDRVLGLAFSPVGRMLASGSRDLTFRLWDMRDPSKPAEFGPPIRENRNSVGKLAFSPNGRLLASGTFLTDVKLWDVSQPGKPVQLSEPVSGDDPNNMGSPLFSPDGHTLLIKVDTDLRLWDISNPGNPLQDCAPFGPYGINISEIGFSPSGRTLAVGSGLVVQLWNVVDVSKPVAIGAPLTGHTDGVGSSVFSPSGRLLAVASGDKTIRLWRVSGPV